MEPTEKIEANFTEPPTEGLNIVPAPGGSVMNSGALQSPNFKTGESGWRISADGVIEAVKAVFIGVSTLNIKSYTNFETEARFPNTYVPAGTGATTFDANGMTLRTGATAGSMVSKSWFVTSRILRGSPLFSCVLYASNVSNDQTGTNDRQRITDIYNIHSALASYKTAQGNYPTSLNPLVPTYISSIPEDPDASLGYSYSYAYKNDQTDAHIGATLSSSLSSSLSLDEDYNSNIAGWTNGFNGADPIFDFRMESATNPALPGSPPGTGSAFFGIGNVSASGVGHIFTASDFSCAGFYVERVGGVVSLYANQSNRGSSTRSAVLTTLYDTDILDLIVKINDNKSVDYYWRKNLGALSSKTTLSTTVPQLIGAANNQFSTSNNMSAYNFNWTVVSASYER